MYFLPISGAAKKTCQASEKYAQKTRFSGPFPFLFSFCFETLTPSGNENKHLLHGVVTSTKTGNRLTST